MPSRILPLAAIFCSGLASLVFQVVWTRMAVLILGTTMEGVTLIVATFMGGLALGNAVSARLIPRLQNPIRAYAWAEFGTLFFSVLLAEAFHSKGALADIPTGVVILAVFAPTFLMGLTTPWVVEGLIRAGLSSDRAPGWAYGLNTLGASVGALIGAFWWLPALGIRGSSYAACGCLVLCIALAWISGTRLFSKHGEGASRAVSGSAVGFGVLALAAWGGASGIGLEIIWTRLLSLILGPSVYALGVVLFSYLIGLALGSVLQPRIGRKLGTELSVGLGFLASTASVAWGVIALGFLPYLFLWIVEVLRPSIHALRWIEGSLSILTIAPFACVQGFLLPALVAWREGSEGKGRVTAWLLAANTAGSIVGSVSVGLYLVPQFGFLALLMAVFLINAGITSAFLLRNPGLGSRSIRRTAAGIFVVFTLVFVWNARGFWDRSILVAGVYKYAVGEALRGGDARIGVGELLYYREGKSSTVAVVKTEKDRVLSVDGKADATAYGDQSTQVLLAALPLSLRPAARETLVIGFASGVTAGVASLFEGNRVTVAEIEPAVYEASRYFLDVNFGPLETPHRLFVNDARHYLLRTSDRFDVITSEPSNPWMSGVAPLFTQEFFELARRRLAEGGVMCQWLPIYGMSYELVTSVLSTFASVFPHVTVFESVEGFDLLLMGSNEEWQLDPHLMEGRWMNESLRMELSSIGLKRGIDLAARFLIGSEGIKDNLASARINTDDNGYLEYRAPLSLHLTTAGSNHTRLLQASEGLSEYLSATVPSNVRKELSLVLDSKGHSIVGKNL